MGMCWRRLRPKVPYGQSDEGRGQKVMVEFVSANPTGPMHMGNARGGGAGRHPGQHSPPGRLRHLERSSMSTTPAIRFTNSPCPFRPATSSSCWGRRRCPFPEDGYHGDDIRELAQAIYDHHGDQYRDVEEAQRLEALAAFGLERNIPKMQADLRRYGIVYDEWFFESSLHESGYVAETVELLGQKGWTYEKDGALWLNTTELLKNKYLAEGKTQEQVDKLDLKDDVLRRANGFYTYFAADIAYHRNKLEVRGFDKSIDVWGADHHGHVAGPGGLGRPGPDGSHRLVVVLMQLVNLLQDGKPVRMSKRSGKAIALHDLLDEVSVDAARYFFNSRASTSPVDFDLDLAVRGGQREPGLLRTVCPRPYLLSDRPSGRGGVCRSQGSGGPVRAALQPGGATSLIRALARLPEGGDPRCCPGLRPLPDQPLSGGAGRRISPFLQRLPH